MDTNASGPTRTAILQIHPSLRCNLACTHCYSNSGPTVTTELAVSTVNDVISDAAAMGYQVVSVSGGEPLMYRGLDRVLAHAKSLGMRTTVTSNGFFNRARRLTELREVLDVLVMSLDGPREFHNEIRGSAQAFEQLEAGLVHVRKADIPFGFIHTLTHRNWHHLLSVADFAFDNGARLLQIHPLELAGRGESEMTGETPSDDVLSKVYVMAFALSCSCRYGDAMKIQLDLLHRDHVREQPNLVYAEEVLEAAPPGMLGLLVLRADGDIVPVTHGFSSRYRVCNVSEQRLLDAWPDYAAKVYPSFKDLCRGIWNDLCAPDAPVLVNWHELIARRSHESGQLHTLGRASRMG